MNIFPSISLFESEYEPHMKGTRTISRKMNMKRLSMTQQAATIEYISRLTLKFLQVSLSATVS